MLNVESHPLLDLRAFVTEFPAPLAEIPSSPELRALLSLEAAAPLTGSDDVRAAVRDLLRYGGFKPGGQMGTQLFFSRRTNGGRTNGDAALFLVFLIAWLDVRGTGPTLTPRLWTRRCFELA